MQLLHMLLTCVVVVGAGAECAVDKCCCCIVADAVYAVVAYVTCVFVVGAGAEKCCCCSCVSR